MSDTLKQLTVLHDQDSWGQYQEEVAQAVCSSNPTAVVFPDDPAQYPCLVAGLLNPVDPTKANNFCQFRISCCFVYPTDAAQLLQAQSQMRQSILDDSPGGMPKPGNSPDLQFEAAEEENKEYAPIRAGVLLLALVNELVDVGAIKRDLLLAEIDRVDKWMRASQQSNIESPHLGAVLRQMWRDKDAG
jgi:hypothetical protein